MSCYLIKTSKYTVSVSTTTGCRARIDGSSGCEDQRGPRGRDTPVTGSFSFRIYEVTKKEVVGCAPISPCSASEWARRSGRPLTPEYSTVEYALDCSLYHALPWHLRFTYDWYIGASETWKQIFPAPPVPENLVREKKANANNMAIKEANKINIKENGNFLDIEGDIAIKTEVPVPELSPINRVKNVGLFLTQNKTNNTPGFLAFKEMIQDLSSTLPEHYNTVISAPAEDPESPTPTPTPVPTPTPTPTVCDPVCIEVHSPEPRCQFGPISDCEVIERFSETVNIPQGMTPPVYVTMTGGADDLLMINGEVVEAGQYIGDRGCYVDGGNYSFVLEDTSFTIGAGDTIGYCSGYDYTICFSPCPPTGTT